MDDATKAPKDVWPCVGKVISTLKIREFIADQMENVRDCDTTGELTWALVTLLSSPGVSDSHKQAVVQAVVDFARQLPAKCFCGLEKSSGYCPVCDNDE